jgi:hypothetical protein
VQKKLIYLYITNYLHEVNNQGTALLAVNSLQVGSRLPYPYPHLPSNPVVAEWHGMF